MSSTAGTFEVPGSRTWVFPGGHIPVEGTGPEPEFTSRDELCLLNAGTEPAAVELTVLHEDRERVGPYPLRVEAGRVRHVRINDLVDPQAVPLGEPYGLVVRSDVPVVAQLTRLDTRRGGLSTAVAPGYWA
ncbi:sensory rhodopsin transducer [Streptomyces sp. ST2-7A]|uniref:sensory rhodopsin transducer n=1 Tax=Streptomyces sp. ST2-7A TaxID=2907214 RepID=UPI001F296829|nr:sensory rhodopsin transducer [Streptomyces sp. ST2-7A]MCE7080997.1 sensory rhodopsin transducer [Streptomyces sp. ST2-7A]